jgi:hypothetical protein
MIATLHVQRRPPATMLDSSILLQFPPRALGNSRREAPPPLRYNKAALLLLPTRSQVDQG